MTTSINPCDVPQLKIGRDVHGRFRPGNQGGPGNPFARKVAALRKTLLDSVSEQDLKDMVETLKLKARQGDTAAIKLLLQYCVGKPESPKDPDRMDVDEWQRLRDMSVTEQQYCETLGGFPACLACYAAEVDWPCESQEGPLDETVRGVRDELDAGNPSAEPRYHSETTTHHSAQPDAAPAQPSAASANHTEKSNAPSEPATPTAERPSFAKGTSQSNDRHQPAGPSRDDSHSPTQPPSPNGGIEDGHQRPPEQGQRPCQPSQPAGTRERKPPRR